MLDQTTKRKIDSARNILVGKVPDPKAQVEQITTALIYKFMDDMDKDSEELGGVADFFSNGFEKYSWTKLMDKRLSGQERLDLYVQAVTTMSKNPHIPQLFRDIFKDAFLPYRDYETLSLFLKEIDGFSYEHSENLGDAFEYLLSVLGSQGNAGQFRTPRHIIDFIVEVVDPKKKENILDPACGTAGFLISAYKHIIKHNSSNFDSKKEKVEEIITEGASVAETVLQEKAVYLGDKLSPEEKTKVMQNIAGYDISPDMVKLSLVNLYLHGFSNPVVHEYDTLTSEKRWNESFDVIMANPPFMTPTGGIRPHKRFQVQANRSEVLFVDYILEHLNPMGRAGLIVPEGIIFQSNNAYKRLRQFLLEDGLFAVVSLPPGVFNPYSGVKTSILLFDNQLAKKTDELLFVKVDNDGFDLGAQRRKIDKNDLPKALKILERWKKEQVINDETTMALAVKKSVIEDSGDFNLTGERYRATESFVSKECPLVELEKIFFEIKNGKNVKQQDRVGKYRVTRIQTISDGTVNLEKTKWTNDEVKESDFMQEGDILMSHINSIEHLAKSAIFHENVEKVVHGTNLIRLRPNKNEVVPEYAAYIFKSKMFINKARSFAQKAVNQASIKVTDLKSIKIPLPTINVQKDIVEQVNVKQKAIDHAKAVIENLERERRYFGQSLRKLENVDWIRLDEQFDKAKEQLNPKGKKGKTVYVGLENIESNTGNLVGNVNSEIEEIKSLKNMFKKGDILYGKLRPNLNKVWVADREGICSTDIFVLRKKTSDIDEDVYAVILRSDDFNKEVLKGLKGAQLPRVGYEYLRTIKIPVLNDQDQKRFAAEIAKEDEAIKANDQLIKLYSEKLSEVIRGI